MRDVLCTRVGDTELVTIAECYPFFLVLLSHLRPLVLTNVYGNCALFHETLVFEMPVTLE